MDTYWEDDPEQRQALIDRFKRQEVFASEGYAPTYEAFFQYFAGLLTENPQDPVAQWLLKASHGIDSLPVSLLLMAGLHRDVLAGNSPLVGYLPLGDDPDFVPALRKAVLQNQERLATFIQTRTVQTNETARGLVWLLPLTASGWKNVHLLDIGASAGLNLVANLRSYTLIDSASDNPLGHVGTAQERQFATAYSGDPSWIPTDSSIPAILSRTGIDIHPFPLDSEAQAQILMAYVWADQIERKNRLREGITAFKTVSARLEAVVLPEGLPAFLNRWSDSLPDNAPLVLYNTFMTAYLARKGMGLREAVTAWARGQNRPVLWLQWEPSYGEEPPAFDLCRYSADLWMGETETHWDLGWVQHHGQRLLLNESWVDFCKRLV